MSASPTKLFHSPRVPISEQSEEQKVYYQFIRAIYKGDEEAFDSLVDQIKDINKSESTNGWAPIAHAVHKNRLKLVEKLVSRGANINVIDHKNGKSILHSSCEHGYTDLVKYLVSQKEIIINTVDKEGINPLYDACRRGFDDIVAILLDIELCNKQVCNVNIKKKQNNQSCLFVACDRGYIKIVTLLLEYKYMKINIDDTDSRSITPLIRACTKSQLEIVKLLLKHGANVNALNAHQQNCLFAAYRVNKQKICKLLLSNPYGESPDLWKPDKHGKYILEYTPKLMDKKISTQIINILHTTLQSAIQAFRDDLPVSVITVICYMTY